MKLAIYTNRQLESSSELVHHSLSETKIPKKSERWKKKIKKEKKETRGPGLKTFETDKSVGKSREVEGHLKFNNGEFRS